MIKLEDHAAATTMVMGIGKVKNNADIIANNRNWQQRTERKGIDLMVREKKSWKEGLFDLNIVYQGLYCHKVLNCPVGK